MNYKSFNLGDWISHISGVIEDESELDGNEMRDLVEFLSGLPRWIPVSERLPEDRQSVLVWCPEYKNIYCAYRENGNWWIFGAFSQIIPNAVIAWHPLPEPYKGGE